MPDDDGDLALSDEISDDVNDGLSSLDDDDEARVDDDADDDV